MSEYPEHEKLQAVKEESQAIGEFLEMGPYTLCTLREAGNNGEHPYVWTGKWTDPKFRKARGVTRKRPNGGDYWKNYAEANPEYESWATHFAPVGKPITELLAEWFEIDLDKIEAEKRSMLDSLRAATA